MCERLPEKTAECAEFAEKTFLCALRVLCGFFFTATPSVAQTVDRFTADSVIAIDVFAGENVSNRPQMLIDVSAGVRLGDNWFFRPWFRKARPSTPTGTSPPWDGQLYQAGI